MDILKREKELREEGTEDEAIDKLAFEFGERRWKNQNIKNLDEKQKIKQN